MDKIFGKAAECAGDALESAIKKACGVKEKDDKKGGFLSFLGGDKDDDDKGDKKKGGLFSFGDDKKKEDDDKGGIFSKIFHKDDDEGTESKGGFKGLFNEPGGPSGGGEKEEMPKFDEGATPDAGAGAGLHDGDVYDDLMDVAEEMSKEK